VAKGDRECYIILSDLMTIRELKQVAPVKDYIRRHKKASGWKALKVPFRFQDYPIEIIIQSYDNFIEERNAISTHSHKTYEEKRLETRQWNEKHIEGYADFVNQLKNLLSS